MCIVHVVDVGELSISKICLVVVFTMFTCMVYRIYYMYYEKGFSEHFHHGNLSLQLTFLATDICRELSVITGTEFSFRLEVY